MPSRLPVSGESLPFTEVKVFVYSRKNPKWTAVVFVVVACLPCAFLHCSCNLGGYGVVGLALSGPKVQGASVLLDQDVINAKGAEATIRRLKAAKIPERNTLGFMFACVGRGQNYYNQSDVESSAFRKVFPSLPLFGLFGNGEIGCDRIVKDDYTLCDSDKKGLQHQYTTVMTLVHFGWLDPQGKGRFGRNGKSAAVLLFWCYGKKIESVQCVSRHDHVFSHCLSPGSAGKRPLWPPVWQHRLVL